MASGLGHLASPPEHSAGQLGPSKGQKNGKVAGQVRRPVVEALCVSVASEGPSHRLEDVQGAPGLLLQGAHGLLLQGLLAPPPPRHWRDGRSPAHPLAGIPRSYFLKGLF